MRLFILFAAVFIHSSAKSATESPNTTEARHCLEDAGCAAERAKVLYNAAVEKGETEVDCTWLYYGILVDKDEVKAFNCFKRSVDADRCNGSSPSMERLFMGAMMASGQGTKAEPAKVMELFQGCLQDAAVGAVMNAARARQEKKGLPPYDFCKTNEGTTLSMSACLGVMGERDRVKGLIEKKSLVAKLDPAQRPHWDKLETAWDDYVQKSATFYAGTEGSIVQVKYPAYIAGKNKERLSTLSKFPSYQPDKKLKASDLVAADKILNTWYGKALESAGGEAEQKNLKEAQRAWLTFRDAESDFYRAVYGKKFGEKVVELDMKTRLTRARNRDLKPIGG